MALFAFAIGAREALAAPQLYTNAGLSTPGLVGSYVNRSMRSVALSDDWRTTETISGTRTDATLAFTTAGWGSRETVGVTGGTDANWDNFSVQWDGYVKVTQAGDRLAPASDDASRMWIDLDGNGTFEAAELIDNGWGGAFGVSMRERSRPLPVGSYRIRIQYYEVNSGNEFYLVSAPWLPRQFSPVAGNPVQVVRVLVLNFEPRIPSEGNKKIWEVFGWNDPRRLAAQFESDLEFATGGAIDVQIVETRHFDEFPKFNDGFRYNAAQYVANRRNNTDWHSGDLDFYWLAERENLTALVNANQVDELWLFGDHFFALLGEAWMAGPHGFFINGPTLPNVGFDRAIAGYGFNYERGVAEMIHNLSHRTENHGQRAFGAWNLTNPVSPFDKFSANYRDSPGKTAGIGTCHVPANAEGDYDYGNVRVLASTAFDWPNFPNLTGATSSVGRSSWGMGPAPDYQRDYLTFYFGLMPRNAGTAADGRQANWFKYIWDFNSYDSTGAVRDEDAFAVGSPIRTSGGTTQNFTVRYYDRTGVNLTTLGSTDIQVTGPGGYSQTATLLNAGPEIATTAGTARTVTYRVTAPGGTWDFGDAGSYAITMRANEVRDTAGNAFPAVALGDFQVLIPNPAAINVAELLANGGATVTNTTVDIGPIGNLFDGSTSTIIRTPNIDPAVVTLTFNAAQNLQGFRAYFSNASGSPAYRWQVETADTLADLDAKTGTWRQAVAQTGVASDVYSTVMLPAAISAKLARLTATRLTGDDYVHIPEWQLLGPTIVDNAAPTAAGSAGATTLGAISQFLTVNYTDATEIDTASLKNGNILVTGPNGFSTSATFYDVDNYLPGATRVGTYWFIPPGGAWDGDDNGVYRIALQAGQVKDTRGNTTAAQELGTITVGFSAASLRPAHDLAENNANAWQSGAESATAQVTNDISRKIFGAAAIRFTTTGGFDTWVRHTASLGEWDLTAASNLYFSIYAVNPSGAGFQAGPWVQLRDVNGGYFEYRYYQNGNTGEYLNIARNQWQPYSVPLRAGDTVANGWRRTVVGAPRLDHIQSVEFHADTWDFGFDLWFDRVGFDLPVEMLSSNFDGGTPHQLTLRFDQSVAASLAAGDLQLQNLTSGATIAPGTMAIAYNAGTDTATVTFPGQAGAKLPDGQYRLSIAANAISDPAGNFLSAPVNYAFLAGADADGDGVLDAWENGNGLSPANASDAAGDLDGDGVSNVVEFRAGTDPRNPTSRFAITAVSLNGSNLQIAWQSVPGRAYRIQMADDLTTWAPLTSGGVPIVVPAAASGGTTSYTVALGGAPARKFCRVEVIFP